MATTIDSIISGDGTNTVTFQLGASVVNGQTGNFVYGGTNTIEDLAGNSLASDSTAVTNSVAASLTDVYRADFLPASTALRTAANNIQHLVGATDDFTTGFEIILGWPASLTTLIVSASGGAVTSYLFSVKTDGALLFQIFSESGAGTGDNYLSWETGAAAIPENTNTYVAASYDQSAETAICYINGSSVTFTKSETGTFPGTMDTDTNVYMRHGNATNNTVERLELNNFWQINSVVGATEIDNIANGADPDSEIAGLDCMMYFEQDVVDDKGNYVFVEPSGSIAYIAN